MAEDGGGIRPNRRQFLMQSAGALGGAAPALSGASAGADAVERARRLRVFVLEHGYRWDWDQLASTLVAANATTVRAAVGIHGEGGGWVTTFPSAHLPKHPLDGDRHELRLVL